MTARRAAPTPARAPIVSRGAAESPAVEIVWHAGPLPPRGDDPLTRAELDFRDLIAGVELGDRVETSGEYHEWCEGVRLAWERENVLWLHGYANGKPVWGRERPPPEVELTAPASPKASTPKASTPPERFKLAQEA